MPPLLFRESLQRGWYQCIPHDALWYSPHWLSPQEATILYDQLDHQLPWQQPTLSLFGKTHHIPRTQCWIGDPDRAYRYSNTTFHPHSWPDFLSAIRKHINQTLFQLAHVERWQPPPAVNSVLANRYQGGSQKMGWHSDDEPELGADPIIVSLSLGETRDMRFRPIPRFARILDRARERIHDFPFTLPLEHGSLLIMGPGSQRDLQHEIPQRKKAEGSRINLTFRHVFSD